MLSTYFQSFNAYLRIERGLSQNTGEAYLRDLHLFQKFLLETQSTGGLQGITHDTVTQFLQTITQLGMAPASQARICSSLRTFFRYCAGESLLISDPMELISNPATERHLPDVLSINDMERLLASIDLSTPKGIRLRAILEILYGCGLRVSELTGLQLSYLHREEEYIQVTGKGNKQRLIPIGYEALKYLDQYLNYVRNKQVIKPDYSDTVFLNNQGRSLSRIIIFNWVKEAVAAAGLEMNISPHSFRHAFATHLMENGASLRAVQEMLGHSCITTTEIYLHLSRKELADTLYQFHPLYQTNHYKK